MTLTSAAGCDSIATLVLTVNPVSQSTTDITICEAQLPYTWNGTSYTAAGTYSVNLSSAAGCDSIATLILTVGPAALSTTQIAICTTQIPFSWNGNSYASAGTYNVTLTSAAGCDSIATLLLEVKPIAKSTTSVTISESEVPFIWNGVSYLNSGSYSFTSTSYAGCDSIANLELQILPSMSSITEKVICQDQFPYKWNDQSYPSPGTYSRKFNGIDGRDSIVTLKLGEHALPTVSLTGPNVICSGNIANIYIQFTGESPWSISYSDGINMKNVTNIGSSLFVLHVTPSLPNTTYTIHSVGDAQCINNTPNVSVSIGIITPPIGVRMPTVNTLANTDQQLHARDLGMGYQYDWSPAFGLNSTSSADPLFNYGYNQEYLISMTSPAGCITTDTLLVRTINDDGTAKSSDILVPRAWTPNGDGHNDLLFPFTVKIVRLNYFRIFNRWGQLMFESKDTGKGWDGNFHGQKQPIDAYLWTAEGISTDGTVIRKQGSATLLR